MSGVEKELVAEVPADGWGVYDLSKETGEVHVIHTTEDGVHARSRACVCGPRVEVESGAWVVSHRRTLPFAPEPRP